MLQACRTHRVFCAGHSQNDRAVCSLLASKDLLRLYYPHTQQSTLYGNVEKRKPWTPYKRFHVTIKEYIIKEYIIKEYIIKEYIIKEYIIKEYINKKEIIKEYIIKEYLHKQGVPT